MVLFSKDVLWRCRVLSTCSSCTPVILLYFVILGSWCFLNHQENLFWFIEIKPVHLSHWYLKPEDLQQKWLKHGDSSSVWRNVKLVCHCQSWISAVDPFNGVGNRCGSFRKEQPKRSRLANEQSSISVLNTNKTTLPLNLNPKILKVILILWSNPQNNLLISLVSLDWFATEMPPVKCCLARSKLKCHGTNWWQLELSKNENLWCKNLGNKGWAYFWTRPAHMRMQT